MGWWWPFKRDDGSSGKAPLDADLQQYYDDVVAKAQQQQKAAPAGPRNGAAPPPIPSNNSRIRATTDTLNSQKTLKQIAMDNCVEYEKAYSSCLVRGTYFERFSGCPTQLTMYEQCQHMQQEALTVLGFARAQTDSQRRAIKAQADDLMIKHAPSLSITDAQVDAFTAALRDLAPN